MTDMQIVGILTCINLCLVGVMAVFLYYAYDQIESLRRWNQNQASKIQKLQNEINRLKRRR